jgi:phage gp45-like
MLYSEDGKQVYMTADGGIVVEAKGQDVVVNNARNVIWNCTGDFTQNVGGKYKVAAAGGVEFDTPTTTTSGSFSAAGDITDNTGSGNAASMATMRTDYNEHDHDVVDVQTGGSTVTTSKPTPTE